jgi:hypothetical protein
VASETLFLNLFSRSNGYPPPAVLTHDDEIPTEVRQRDELEEA